MFPRELKEIEKQVLLKLLPGDKPGYRIYRNKIELSSIIGLGRFGGSNYILGSKGDTPDNNQPSTAVFAMGKASFDNESYHINIHEEDDNKIEIELDGIELLDDTKSENIKLWSYSDWLPGDKAPNDESEVREVTFEGTGYMLVFAPGHNRIWLHESDSGVNYLIPVTNYFNELMMLKRERSVKPPSKIFDQLEAYTDYDLKKSFINYNRYMSKFNIDLNEEENSGGNKKNMFKKIFNRRG